MQYERMLDIARKLSEGLKFVRIDLYEIDNKVYFSEITFTPCSGLMTFDPPEWDYILGKWIKLPLPNNWE